MGGIQFIEALCLNVAELRIYWITDLHSNVFSNATGREPYPDLILYQAPRKWRIHDPERGLSDIIPLPKK